MKIKINRLFSKTILALGLVSIFLVSAPGRTYAAPSTVDGDVTTTEWTDRDGTQHREVSNSKTGEKKVSTVNPGPNGMGQTITTNSKTGDYQLESTSIDPQTGEVKGTVYKKDKAGNATWTEITTNKSGDQHSETYAYDPTMNPATGRTKTYDHKISETSRAAEGFAETTKTYDPKTGYMTSKSETGADGTVHTANYTGNCSQFGGSNCHKTSETVYDPKTTRKSSTGYKSNGKVDYVHDTYQDGTQSQLTYGPDGKVKSAWGYDPKTKQSNFTDYNGDGSVTHSVVGTGPDGKAVLVSKENTSKDGVHHTDTYAPGCTSNSGGGGCKVVSTVDDFGGSQTKKTFDPASGKLVSQTDTGPNNYQKSTTYDPKTGFMTSQSQTQSDGVHTVNYTGNCSQFGGSDCHKSSEIITDPKTNKIVSAKSCDNKGNCKNVDPKTIQGWAVGPIIPAIPSAQAPGEGLDRRQRAQAAGAAVPPADDPNRQPPLQPPTKNPDGSTTTVTKNPDGSTTTLKKSANGSSTRTELGQDGKTLGIQTFDAQGKQTSATAFGQDGKKTLYRTFDDKGGSISTKFGPDGRPASVDSIDPNGKLTTVKCDVPAVCAKALNQQQAQFSGAKALKADTKPQGLTDAKKNVKSDVLKQIGNKPSGDLKNDKEKFKTNVLEKIKHNRGEAIGLNPQPLPPGTPSDKVDKNTHLDNKINIGSYKSSNKEGFAKGELKPESKVNGKVVPQSQSSSQAAVGNKYLPQSKMTEKLKKSKSQNWSSSAGSQGTVKRYPLEKQR